MFCYLLLCALLALLYGLLALLWSAICSFHSGVKILVDIILPYCDLITLLVNLLILRTLISELRKKN